jgi:hypothetical protein
MKSKQKKKDTANLFREEPIDKGINSFIERINNAGYETFASCSALSSEHGPLENGEWPYVCIILPDGLIKTKKAFHIKYNDFNDKVVYHKFKQVRKKSGWFLHFIRRKKYLTPLLHASFMISKKRQSDKQILRAWKRLTEALEKADAYKTYFSKPSTRK